MPDAGERGTRRRPAAFRLPAAVAVAVGAATLLAACGGAAGGRGSSAAASHRATTTTAPATSSAGSSASSGSTASIGSTGSSGSAASLRPAPAQGGPGPETVPVPSVPVLTGLSTAATGQPVDGITCDTSEQTLYHIHVHLTLFVDGAQRQVPAGIGIPHVQFQQTPEGPFADGGSCLYWLHTHAGDGIVHVESPKQATFTLGDFFDIWGQPLSATQVGPATGPVTVFVDGQPYTGDPRAITFTEHKEIQLEVGSPLVAPVTVSSWGGL